MKRVLLDTNILVDWLRGQRSSRPKHPEEEYNRNSAVTFIKSLIDDDVDICVSCHTIKELLQYPHISEQEEKRILMNLPMFCTILNTDLKVAITAGILSRYSQEYRFHHVEDCYIASTAIINNIPLFTRNPKDFKYINAIEGFDLDLNIPYEYIDT